MVKEMADNLALELVAQDLLTQSVFLGLSYESSENLPYSDGTDKTVRPTSSSKELMAAVEKLYDRIVIPGALVRRINLAFLRLTDNAYLQYDLFMDPEDLERENRLQRAAIEIKERFGANAILKGMDLQKNATTRERNDQIGGHKK